MSTREPRVHAARGGAPRCGVLRWKLLADARDQVTCRSCLGILAGTHGVGNRKRDEGCGTAAGYRWHLRHDGPPVLCRRCLAAESRRPPRPRRSPRRRALRLERVLPVATAPGYEIGAAA